MGHQSANGHVGVAALLTAWSMHFFGGLTFTHVMQRPPARLGCQAVGRRHPRTNVERGAAGSTSSDSGLQSMAVGIASGLLFLAIPSPALAAKLDMDAGDASSEEFSSLLKSDRLSNFKMNIISIQVGERSATGKVSQDGPSDTCTSFSCMKSNSDVPPPAAKPDTESLPAAAKK
eukprot:CAMPEP_0179103264 /NCGR_PEP_ID=MMETSP0796-20121207/47838_1 /TAXON_ID=73915 /ORGANISM="Pyrodinium bahamense, Strain pbaha01" /LENGTH=174 /DNA_ID=CAMNT_0020801165 /DNA_START=57 /DNA_END=581 /DNA_ORIENTATION=+